MDDHAPAEQSFPVGWCAFCEREVLTHAGDGEGRLCVHCDQPLRGAVRTARGDQLEERGYAIVELEGCGNPDCGGGRCLRS